MFYQKLSLSIDFSLFLLFSFSIPKSLSPKFSFHFPLSVSFLDIFLPLLHILFSLAFVCYSMFMHVTYFRIYFLLFLVTQFPPISNLNFFHFSILSKGRICFRLHIFSTVSFLTQSIILNQSRNTFSMLSLPKGIEKNPR